MLWLQPCFCVQVLTFFMILFSGLLLNTTHASFLNTTYYNDYVHYFSKKSYIQVESDYKWNYELSSVPE